VGGDSKIPTILYYNQQGEVCAVGDEATEDDIEQTAQEREWTKAEWYGAPIFFYGADKRKLT
jgi:hypothetical protein